MEDKVHENERISLLVPYKIAAKPRTGTIYLFLAGTEFQYWHNLSKMNCFIYFRTTFYNFYNIT